MDAFSRLAPFIQDFIYANNWTSLRANQVAACDVILGSNDNLLLHSETASGKTEAAFLPILTLVYNDPPKSVGVIYISPLKALINDQFVRLDALIRESGVSVCKWHGDANPAQKERLLKNPSGILQITPESLESLLINKKNAAFKMFSDLRFVIIDETHYFMKSPRGAQVLCQLARLQKLLGYAPRRVGLSATIGDIGQAKKWLGTDTGRSCAAPEFLPEKKRAELLVRRFENLPLGDAAVSLSAQSGLYEFLFNETLGKKTIIFANSREEVEVIMANLRKIAKARNKPDVYRVHHGNISAVLRETTEEEMKYSDVPIVTGATVTLELGIDIGALDMVAQIGAPLSVSSFAQRLGRCGRRGQTARLLFALTDEANVTAADVIGPINWNFVRLIAIIELFFKEKYIENAPPNDYPFALLYHQTMSRLAAGAEVSRERLKGQMLSMGVFSKISPAQYDCLLDRLTESGQLQSADGGGLIIGPMGERVINHFHFYTVFEIPEYYQVKSDNMPIGTVDKIYPKGETFALAGHAWETVEVNKKAKVIFVKPVEGVSLVDWDADFAAALDTVLVKKMKAVLAGNEQYPYLDAGAAERLAEMRFIAKASGILKKAAAQTAKDRFAIFPWVGSRQLLTLFYALKQRGVECAAPKTYGVYLEAKFSKGEGELARVAREAALANANALSLPIPENARVKNKYNEFVPDALLRFQYAKDFLDPAGLAAGYEF